MIKSDEVELKKEIIVDARCAIMCIIINLPTILT